MNHLRYRKRQQITRRRKLWSELLEPRELLTGMESEPNDSIATANNVSLEESSAIPSLVHGVMTGNLELGASDFFRLTALAGDQISISANADAAFDLGTVAIQLALFEHEPALPCP